MISTYFSISKGAQVSGRNARPWFSNLEEEWIILPDETILIDALAALATNEMAAQSFYRLLLSDSGPERDVAILQLMQSLIGRGIITERIALGGKTIASRLGIGTQANSVLTPPRTRFKLSKFAYCRTVDGDLVMESPLSDSRVILHDRRAIACLHRLKDPIVLTATYTQDEDALIDHSIAGMLIQANLMIPSDQAESSWSFHDRLFHAWTRFGQVMLPYGIPASAIEVPTHEHPSPDTPLDDSVAPPTITRSKELDSFLEILWARASVRRHGEDPISASDLSTFLFHAAGLKSSRGARRASYPSPGARYPLCAYPVVRRCSGLESGLYRYDAQQHQLFPMRQYDHAIDRLFNEYARLAKMSVASAQCLIIITMQYDKVSDYQRVALANTLKELGGLYQTMYLVATAMGLAPCAVGGGDTNRFAQVSGLGSTESSIGEFFLGSLP